MNKKYRGVSLIVLVITILVVIILASIIILTFKTTNPIKRAQEAKFKSDLRGFKEELLAYISDREIADVSFDRSTINATGYTGLKKYIPDITEEYANKVYIKNGNLMYVDDENQEYDEREQNWADQVGIISPYSIYGDVDGDGEITLSDSELVQLYLGEDAELSDKQKIAADVIKDNHINPADVTCIQRYLSDVPYGSEYIGKKIN